MYVCGVESVDRAVDRAVDRVDRVDRVDLCDSDPTLWASPDVRACLNMWEPPATGRKKKEEGVEVVLVLVKKNFMFYLLRSDYFSGRSLLSYQKSQRIMMLRIIMTIW